jgi:hypothetical protein
MGFCEFRVDYLFIGSPDVPASVGSHVGLEARSYCLSVSICGYALFWGLIVVQGSYGGFGSILKYEEQENVFKNRAAGI